MKAVVLLVVLAAALARPEWETHYMWEKFRAEHKKLYTSAAEAMERFTVFRDAVNYIDAENAKGNTYTLGVTQFADMTNEEFKQQFHSIKPTETQGVMFEGEVPNDIDWTTMGAVTPVKNQAQCGSCWAFSSTGAAEGAYFIKTGQLLSFSEQQLVDCSSSFGNHGCSGGLMDNAFRYWVQNGICLESDYGYTARDGTCQKTCTPAAQPTGYTDIQKYSKAAMEAAIAKQPVAVAIEADRQVFQYYKSGVITGTACGTSLDHGVLAVGYGTLSGTDYIKVKNSWGASWGMNGYVLIGRDTTSYGVCGIYMMPSIVNF
jgi:C1A family cysteine protease